MQMTCQWRLGSVRSIVAWCSGAAVPAAAGMGIDAVQPATGMACLKSSKGSNCRATGLYLGCVSACWLACTLSSMRDPVGHTPEKHATMPEVIQDGILPEKTACLAFTTCCCLRIALSNASIKSLRLPCGVCRYL